MLASRSDIFMRRLGAVDETWLVDPETCMSKRDSDGSANRQREHMAKLPSFQLISSIRLAAGHSALASR